MRIAICDDEREVLNSEYELIKSVISEKNIFCKIDMFTSSQIFLTSEKSYDIVFLDIEMNGVNGIKLAEHIHRINSQCLIFFVTNYETYMDEALNKHAFRFWTKPIDKDRLIYGINSALKEINDRKIKIKVSIDDYEIDIDACNIIYLFTQEKKIHIITTRGEITARGIFEKVTEPLESCDYFYKCHNSYYVNFNYIRSYTSNSILCMSDGVKYDVYMSRRKYSSFRKEFMEWIGGK